MSEHAPHCPKLPWMIDFFSTQHGTVPNNQLSAAYADSHLGYLTSLNHESVPARKRLTGIICTIGPQSYSVQTLEELIQSGMCCARLKMPFFTRTECEHVITSIREACDNHSRKMGSMYPIAIAMDLRGPEIRTGFLKNPNAGEVELIQGNETVITTDPSYEEHVTEDMIFVDYQKIHEIVEPGDKFYLDNNITLSALEIVGSFIKCIIERAGRIGDRVNVSMESSVLDLPTVSEIEIEFAKEQGIDVIIVSAVKDASQIQDVKKILGPEGLPMMIVSKIEDSFGVKNIEAIIKESDGILISRSDLCVELSQEKLFLVQKMIIAACNKAGKPVICAPQMLESMFSNSDPKRSEVMDVCNAILDGADCILLSRETASGDYPVDCVRVLSNLCKESESAVYQKQIFQDLSNQIKSPIEPIYALSIGVVETSMKTSAAAIILLTTSGRTAKVIASFRPRCPIIAITRYARVSRQLKMFRAIEPIHFIAKPLDNWYKDVRKRVQFGITYGKYNGFIRAADTIIVVTGARPGAGFTNCMNVYYASDFDSIAHDDKAKKKQKISMHL